MSEEVGRRWNRRRVGWEIGVEGGKVVGGPKLNRRQRGFRRTKKQADGKRAARGRCSLELGLNRGAEYLRRRGHSGEGFPRPDGWRRIS